MHHPPSGGSKRDMRKLGSAQSRRKPSADPSTALVAATGFCAPSAGGSPPAFSVVGDAIPASLTGAAGDPASGRAIVLDRRLGACLMWRTGPFPEARTLLFFPAGREKNASAAMAITKNIINM